jgi:hypothetical protein
LVVVELAAAMILEGLPEPRRAQQAAEVIGTEWRTTRHMLQHVPTFLDARR